jgi:hypothetical protein
MIESHPQQLADSLGYPGYTVEEGISDLLIWYPLLEEESDPLWIGIP